MDWPLRAAFFNLFGNYRALFMAHPTLKKSEIIAYSAFDEPRLNYIKIVSILGFISSLLISYKLWLADRFFPLIPLIQGFVLVHWAHSILFFLLLLNLLVLLFWFRSTWIWVCWGLLGIMITLDLNRLQVWVYFYVLIFISLFPHPAKKQATQGLLFVQWVLIAMYLWGGIHKLNGSFLEIEFPKMLQDFFYKVGLPWQQRYQFLAYFIPLTEMATAVLLFFPKTRPGGLILAIGTHLSILVMLLGLKQNYVVIPWNLVLIALSFLVFFRNSRALANLDRRGLIFLWFVGVMPMFLLFGAWSDNLSWSLYSARNKVFYVAIAKGHWPVFRSHLAGTQISEESNPAHYVIDVNKWSYQELGVPVNPESRVFNGISRFFCSFGLPENALVFMEYQKPVNPANLRQWICE